MILLGGGGPLRLRFFGGGGRFMKYMTRIK